MSPFEYLDCSLYDLFYLYRLKTNNPDENSVRRETGKTIETNIERTYSVGVQFINLVTLIYTIFRRNL